MVELLAPAGSLTSLKKAIKHGADSIYFGGKIVENMRSASNNLNDSDINIGVKLAHKKNRKVYITFNSPFSEETLPILKRRIQFYSKLKVDALIVSDFGLMAYLHENFPDLDIHASIQAGICNSNFAKAIKKIGVKRVILERCMSLEEIKSIKRQSALEVEIFVFGPLCYSFDSLCFIGDFFENKNCGNNCMRKYSGKRAFLMGYLNLIKKIPEIIESGIDCIKIEGRTRSSEYVRKTTEVFRKAICQYNSQGSLNILPSWKKQLNECALGFEQTKGLFSGDDGIRIKKEISWQNRMLYAKELANLAFEGSFGDALYKAKLATKVDRIRNIKK